MYTQRFLLVIFVFALATACKPKAPVEEEGFLSISGSDVYFKTVGEGDPLLIIHGGPVLDHTYLYEHFKPLASDYQLIFYDQRACGQSSIEIDSASMNIAGFVDDIDQLRKALGHKQMHVLGHSWGGLLAMKYALAYPEQVQRLILSNTMAPSARDWAIDNLKQAEKINVQDQKRLDKLVSSGLLRSPQAAEYVDEMMRLAYKSQMYDPKNMERLNLNISADFPLRNRVFSLLSPDMARYDLYEALEEMNTPTLIVFGEQETGISTFGEKVTQILPQAQMELVAKAGHFPFIEQPKAYFSVVKAFLNE